MKIVKNDGTVEDVSTGLARRQIQAGEATEYTPPKHDDKPKPKGTKKDSGADGPSVHSTRPEEGRKD